MKKRVVLVTGANRGIGFAVAKKFLDEGDIVVFTARRQEAGQKAFEALGHHKDLHFHLLDIARDDSVTEVKNYVEETFGRLDVLVNNAAINYDTWQSALAVDMANVMETFNVNTLGAWRMAQAFIPLMKSKGYGRVINLSSGSGAFDEMGSGTPAYSISKAALNALTVKLANNLRGSNVLVNSLCPGWVITDMGGAGASRSPEAAAQDIYDLSNDDSTQGKFLRYGQVINF